MTVEQNSQEELHDEMNSGSEKSQPSDPEVNPELAGMGAADAAHEDKATTVPVENAEEATTTYQEMANTAREQAGVAADALRRGQFMSDAAVDPDADQDDRLIGLLCYLSQIAVPLVMPAIVLFSASSQKRPFQRYHAVQSLGLAVVILALLGIMAVGGGMLMIIPILGWIVGGLLLCLLPIAGIMAVVSALYYGYQAYQGKRFAIPGLTSFLHDQGWL